MRRKFSFKVKLDIFLLILLLIISSVLLTFSGGRFIVDFKSVGFSVAAGTENAVHSVSTFVTDAVSAVRELAELRSKYVALSEKLKDYELLQRSNADIRRENKELKELLGFADMIAYKNIPAQVVGFDPDNLYSGIIINRGTKHGVRKNMPVLAFQGSNVGLVGKIVQAGRDSSMIIPIYDYQCYVAASIQTTKHRGLINGQGTAELPLIMKYVQKQVDLHMRPIVIADEEVTDSAVRRLLNDAGEDIDDLMTLCEADITSKNVARKQRFLDNFRIVREKLKDLKERDYKRLLQPCIDGNEIMEMFHLKPSREVGILKQTLKDAVLDNKVANEREPLMELLRSKARELGLI